VAIIDVAGFIAYLKDHAADHEFHIHGERHFVETYSLRQAWEVDLQTDEGCGGPVELHLTLEVEPRVLLGFEDKMLELPDDADPPPGFSFPMTFSWSLPPLTHGPDLLVLATDLAGIGGADLPLEVSAIDSMAHVIDAPERAITIVGRTEVGLEGIYNGADLLCDTLDRCARVSNYLDERAPAWLDS
jgi:hypothetical protein